MEGQKNKKGILIGIVVGALAIIGGVAAFIITKNKKKKKEEEQQKQQQQLLRTSVTDSSSSPSGSTNFDENDILGNKIADKDKILQKIKGSNSEKWYNWVMGTLRPFVKYAKNKNLPLTMDEQGYKNAQEVGNKISEDPIYSTGIDKEVAKKIIPDNYKWMLARADGRTLHDQILLTAEHMFDTGKK